MPTITDDVSVARGSLAETDDFSTVEVSLREVTIDVKDNADAGGEVSFSVEGQDVPLSEYAVRTLAGEMGIPTNYILTSPAWLQTHMLRHGQSSISERKRALLVIGGDHVQSVTSKNFLPPKMLPIFDRMMEKLSGAASDRLKMNYFEHSWQSTRFMFTHEDASHEVENAHFKGLHPEQHVGDIVQAGVNFVGSLVNDSHLEVQPAVFRLFCSNRMVTPVLHTNDEFYRWKRDYGRPSDWIESVIEELGKDLEPLFKELDKAASQAVDVDVSLAAAVGGLPGPLRDATRAAYDEEPMPTLWGITNAMTRAATHAEQLAPGHRLSAERSAGLLTHRGECPSCHRAFNGGHTH